MKNLEGILQEEREKLQEAIDKAGVAIQYDIQKDFYQAIQFYSDAVEILKNYEKREDVKLLVDQYVRRIEIIAQKQELQQNISQIGQMENGQQIISDKWVLVNSIGGRELEKFSIEGALNTFSFNQKVKLMLKTLFNLVQNGGNLTKMIYVPTSIWDIPGESNQTAKIEFFERFLSQLDLLKNENIDFKEFKEYLVQQYKKGNLQSIINQQHDLIQEKLQNNNFSLEKQFKKGLQNLLNIKQEQCFNQQKITSQILEKCLHLHESIQDIEQNLRQFYLVYMKDIVIKIILNDIEIRLYQLINQLNKKLLNA